MEKKILRMMATGLVGCMLAVTATGCGNSGTSSTPATSDTSASNTTNESTSSDSSTAKDESSSQDIVSLKWIQIGNGQPDNYDAWQAHINETGRREEVPSSIQERIMISFSQMM